MGKKIIFFLLYEVNRDKKQKSNIFSKKKY